MYNKNKSIYEQVASLMVTKDETLQAFKKLSVLQQAKIGDSMMGLFLQPEDYGSKLHMHSLVYIGDGFIPFSVRKAAQSHVDTNPVVDTWLHINEEQFKISLHFVQSFTKVTSHDFFTLTARFEEAVIRWRQILEEKDREDLVYIHSTP